MAARQNCTLGLLAHASLAQQRGRQPGRHWVQFSRTPWCRNLHHQYPVVANGRLYIRDAGALWCYDVKAEK